MGQLNVEAALRRHLAIPQTRGRRYSIQSIKLTDSQAVASGFGNPTGVVRLTLLYIWRLRSPVPERGSAPSGFLMPETLNSKLV